MPVQRPLPDPESVSRPGNGVFNKCPRWFFSGEAEERMRQAHGRAVGPACRTLEVRHFTFSPISSSTRSQGFGAELCLKDVFAPLLLVTVEIEQVEGGGFLHLQRSRWQGSALHCCGEVTVLESGLSPPSPRPCQEQTQCAVARPGCCVSLSEISHLLSVTWGAWLGQSWPRM